MPSKFLKLMLFSPLFILSACGGGGGDGDDNNGLPPPDSLAPTLNLTVSTIKASPGQEVFFTHSASDNIDQSVNGTLTCNAGTLSDDVLTIPDTQADMVVECSYTATDQSGNQAVINVSIQVIALEFIVSSLKPALSAMSPITVEIIGTLELDQTIVKGSIDSELIDIVPLSDKTFVFVIPAGISGDTPLSFFIDGISISIPLTIEEVISPTNPTNYVSSEIDSYLALLDVTIQATNDPSAIEARNKIQEGLNRFNELTEKEIISLSLLLAQLSEANSQQNNMSSNSSKLAMFSSYSVGYACREASVGLIVNSTGILASYGVAILGALSIPETGPFGMFFTGFGLYYGQIFRPAFKEDLRDVKDNCGVVDSVDLQLFGSQQAITNSSIATDHRQYQQTRSTPPSIFGKNDASLLSPTALSAISANVQLRNGESTNLTLKLNVSHEDAAMADTITATLKKVKHLLIKIEEKVSGLTGDLITVIGSEVSYSTNFDAKNLVLSSVSHPNISGNIVSAKQQNIQLVFSFYDTSTVSNSGRESFIFVLTDTDTNKAYTFSADLNLEGLPFADAASYTVMAGEGFYGVLTGELAENFEFTDSGSEGLATMLIAETGQFGYDAPTDYSGEDTLEFIAINSTGKSVPTKISVDIINHCEREETDVPELYAFYYLIKCYIKYDDGVQKEIYRDSFTEDTPNEDDRYYIHLDLEVSEQVSERHYNIKQELDYQLGLSSGILQSFLHTVSHEDSGTHKVSLGAEIRTEYNSSYDERYTALHDVTTEDYNINDYNFVTLKIRQGVYSAERLKRNELGGTIIERTSGEEALQWYIEAVDVVRTLITSKKFLTEKNSMNWNDNFGQIKDRYFVPWYEPK